MIGRLRDRLRRLFGREGADHEGDGTRDPGATDGDAGATDHECTVCGTAVAGPESACPLCGSDDVALAGRGGEAGPGPDPGAAEVRQAETTDDAAARLREFRERRGEDPD